MASSDDDNRPSGGCLWLAICFIVCMIAIFGAAALVQK